MAFISTALQTAFSVTCNDLHGATLISVLINLIVALDKVDHTTSISILYLMLQGSMLTWLIFYISDCFCFFLSSFLLLPYLFDRGSIRASHHCGLSRCGAQAPDVQAQRPRLTGPAALQHVGSSRTRARTRVPCIGRRTLNHCATREAPNILFKCICMIACITK